MTLNNQDIFKLGMAYHKGAISESLLKKICKEMNYKCKIDNAGGVMITSKLKKENKQ